MKPESVPHAGLFLLQAALMILAGVVALVYPLVSTIAVTLFLGWVLVISGIVQAFTLIATSKMPRFWLQLVSAVLSIITGLLFVRNPGVGVTTFYLLNNPALTLLALGIFIGIQLISEGIAIG